MKRVFFLAALTLPLWGQSSSITGRVLDSAEALIQGTIHRSASAGAAKVRLRPHITHP